MCNVWYVKTKLSFPVFLKKNIPVQDRILEKILEKNIFGRTIRSQSYKEIFTCCFSQEADHY